VSTDLNDGNGSDALYLFTSLGIAVASGYGIGALPAGARVESGLGAVSNLSNVGWVWTPGGASEPPRPVSADPRVVFAYRPPTAQEQFDRFIAPVQQRVGEWWQSQWWNPSNLWATG
jgi:hypothetical protein